MDAILANEKLYLLSVTDWPNINDKGRAREWARLEKIASRGQGKGARKVTNEELQHILGSR